MRISDLIESFIKDLLRESDSIEIQRNDLAQQFNCYPSQINYVINTRFNLERGYIIESRRGGGGYVKINRINIDKPNYIMHIVNSIGDRISADTVKAFIHNCLDYEVVTEREAGMMYSATSDNTLLIPQPQRDTLRALILKNVIISLLR